MWEQCNLESSVKKLFLFFPEDIECVGQTFLTETVHRGYTPMPLNASALGLTSRAGLPFTMIDTWMGTDSYTEARENGTRLSNGWFGRPVEDLVSDGIYWPGFDREAMHWFWQIVGLVHRFATAFDDHGGGAVEIAADRRPRPALYYFPSDVAAVLLKALLGSKTRLVEISKRTGVGNLHAQGIAFGKDMGAASTAPCSVLEGKIVLAVNPGEIHRFSPVIEDLKTRFPGKIAVATIFPGRNLAKNISATYGIPVVTPAAVAPILDRSLVSRFQQGITALKHHSDEPMVQAAIEHLWFHFQYYWGYRWPVLSNNFLAWRNLWSRFRPEAVVVSRLPDGESQLPAMGAKQLGIPTFSIPHAQFLSTEKKITDADGVLCNSALSARILKIAGFDEQRLHICRDLINDDEYETVALPMAHEDKPWKCLVLTYPPTGETFTPKACPGVHLSALTALAHPPGNISDHLMVKFKTHPAYPELEYFHHAGIDVEKQVVPSRTPITSALKHVDLVIALNCSYSVIIHVLRQRKPIIFFYSDPFYLNGVDVHAAAYLFLPAGMLVRTPDELWAAVRSFFTDKVYAEKLTKQAAGFAADHLDDRSYPSAGEVVARVLCDPMTLSAQKKDRQSPLVQRSSDPPRTACSANAALQMEKKLIHEKTLSWQTEESAKVFMDDMAANRLYNRVVNRRFQEYCPPGARVLDLGCGHGILSLDLAERGCSVVSCDISQPLLDALAVSKGDLPIETRRGDAHAIPAKDGEFDVVASRMFLPHFPDWPDIVAEMSRCCRPGGRLIFTFFNRDHRDMAQKDPKYACEFESYPDPTAYSGKFLANCSVKELTTLCKKLDLEVVARHPFHLFAQNAFVGHSLGTEKYEKFKSEFLEMKKDPKVVDFLIWLEESVVQHLPGFMTYDQVVVLEKRRRPAK